MKTTFYKSIRFYISLFCMAGYLALDFFSIPIFSDELLRRLFNDTLQHTLGFICALLLLHQSSVALFKKPKNLLSLLPCFLVALHNFPYISFFKGNMELVKASTLGISLFALSCFSVGLLEECIFRGVFFYLLLVYLPKTKIGFLKAYFYSSLLFGVAHIFNLFSGADVFSTFLQVAYIVLTGGMFAFLFIKTQNIICSALIHGVYNFCGTLFSSSYFGTGVVFDFVSGLLFAIVSIFVGIYILHFIFNYTDADRKDLYQSLGIHPE